MEQLSREVTVTSILLNKAICEGNTNAIAALAHIQVTLIESILCTLAERSTNDSKVQS